MYGAQSIGEAALSASPSAVIGGSGVFTEDLGEAFAVADALSTVLQISILFAETTVPEADVVLVGLPASEAISANCDLSAQFVAADLWTQITREGPDWTYTITDDVTWLTLLPGVADWTNQ